MGQIAGPREWTNWFGLKITLVSHPNTKEEV